MHNVLWCADEQKPLQKANTKIKEVAEKIIHTQKGIRKSFKRAWKSTKPTIRSVSFIVLLSGLRQAHQQMEVLILIAPFSFYIAATET